MTLRNDKHEARLIRSAPSNYQERNESFALSVHSITALLFVRRVYE